jgi:N-methylhydantoinase B
MLGGGPGRPARYTLTTIDGSVHELKSKATFKVEPGEVVTYETCGGGGYGDPLDRDPDLVARDVRHGKVDPRRARDVYGVALDSAHAVDEGATVELRARMRVGARA